MLTYLPLIIIVAIAFILLVIVLAIVSIYNKFIVLRTSVDEASSDIHVQFKRRYDLIPNLVETVKGYSSFEKDTLIQVTEARNMAMHATNLKDESNAQDLLSGALKSLFAVSEAYPDLKSNQLFLDLQHQLSEIEDKIQASRRFYNANIKQYTIATQIFPNSLIAKFFGFTSGKYFELSEGEEAAKEPVKVNFN